MMYPEVYRNHIGKPHAVMPVACFHYELILYSDIQNGTAQIQYSQKFIQHLINGMFDMDHALGPGTTALFIDMLGTSEQLITTRSQPGFGSRGYDLRFRLSFTWIFDEHGQHRRPCFISY